ncbi:MAG: right-handed parallel beta-helix repeat-containing protein [Hyphomicrobiaceae bacterium]
MYPRNSTRAFAVILMMGTGWSTLGLAGERGFGASTAKWHPWFEIGGYYNSNDADGNGPFGTSRGEESVFVPVVGNNRSLVFGQLTTKFFKDEALEGNLAFGYRRMLLSGFNAGVWLGGDVRRTKADNTFWQLSGGFELLSHDFDARLNWYSSMTGPQRSEDSAMDLIITDTQISLTGGEEVGMFGVDAEVGIRMPTSLIGFVPSIFELRVYGGGYYFDHHDAYEEIAGSKGRVELRINEVFGTGSRLTAEYEISHDDVRDTRHEVGGRARIPLRFGGAARRRMTRLSAQERRMLDGLERDTDVVTGLGGVENVEDALTGTDFDRVVTVDAGGSVTDKSKSAGANSLIIVNGEVKGQQSLQGDQTLQGGGTTIAVRGRTSGTVVNFTAPGAAAKLTSPGEEANSLILLASNTHVSGLSIDGGGGTADADSWGHGIHLGSNTRNMFITNVDVSNLAGDGIRAQDGNALSVFDTHIWDTGGHGIHFNNDNDIWIRGGSVSDTAGAGVSGGSGNAVDIAGLDVSNTGRHGIEFWDDNVVTVADVTIADTGLNGETDSGSGISFNDSNTAKILGGSIVRTLGHGISFHDSNGDGDDSRFVWIEGIAIGEAVEEEGPPGIGGHGIVFNDDNEDVTIRDVTITNVAKSGIAFNNRNKHVTIEGDQARTEIVDVGEHGITFLDENTVTIAAVAIADTGQSGDQDNGDGIAFQDGNTVSVTIADVSNAGGHGIRFWDNNTVTITDVTIADTGQIGDQEKGDGISLQDGNTATVLGGSIVRTLGHGISFHDGNGHVDVDDRFVWIEGVTIGEAGETDGPASIGGNGISFHDNNADVNIRDVTVTNASGVGIAFNNLNKDIVIEGDQTGTTITGVGKQGINFKDENEHVIISNVAISGSGLSGSGRWTNISGIQFHNSNKFITIRDVDIMDTYDSGISFWEENEDIDIIGAKVTAAGGSGISVFVRNSRVRITDATISNVGEVGIVATSHNSDIEIADTTITNAFLPGIFFRESNKGVKIFNTSITNVGNGEPHIFAGLNGIQMDDGNDVELSFVTIGEVVGNAFQIGGSNVIFNNVTLSGPVGQHAFNFTGGKSDMTGNINNVNTTGNDVTCNATDSRAEKAFAGSIAFDTNTLTADDCIVIE